MRRRPRWRDWVGETERAALVGVILLAAALRFVGLGHPDQLVFDEVYYAQDACSFLGWGVSTCGVESEASRVHPPLGKWLIAGGIAVFGHTPVGWRVVPAIAGVATVWLVYLLARRLTQSTLAAAVAAALLALDPLSIISSRVAMLDVFVSCASVATVLFVVLDRQRRQRDQGKPGSPFRPWLAAAGIAAGCAIAVKWSGLYVLPAAIVLVAAPEIAGARRHQPGRALIRASALRPVVLWLVATPLCLYVASYAGRLDAELLALPWRNGSWPREFIDRQLFMAAFHLGLDDTHPYASPAWSWPLAKRAVVYFFETDPAGRYREILAVANPLVWLPGFAAAGLAGLAAIGRWRTVMPRSEALTVALAVAASYLPWLVLSIGRPFVFLHYFVPTVPSLAVALGWAVAMLPQRAGRTAAASLVALAAAVVLFLAPLLYAQPIDYESWRARILFADCTSAEVIGGRLAPRAGGGPPPPGWCWV